MVRTWHDLMDGNLKRRLGYPGWPNRFFLRHLILGPALCFAGGGIIIGLSLASGMHGAMFLSIPLLLIGFLLLIYALIRKAVGLSSTKSDASPDESVEEYGEYKEIDERARQRAIDSWRRRARQDRHQRRNPGG